MMGCGSQWGWVGKENRCVGSPGGAVATGPRIGTDSPQEMTSRLRCPQDEGRKELFGQPSGGCEGLTWRRAGAHQGQWAQSVKETWWGRGSEVGKAMWDLVATLRTLDASLRP